MSEEEKKLFEAIKYKNKHLFLVKVDADFLINLIEEQQKELNSLKEIEQLHKEENGKLRVELNNLKEKNKELQKYEEAYKLLSYGLNNYICKDRVKAEMEDIIDYFEYANATSEDMEFLEKKKKEILEEK